MAENMNNGGRPTSTDAKARRRDYLRSYMRRYMAKYRREHPEAVKRHRENYMLRVAAKIKAEREAAAAGEASTRSVAHQDRQGQQQAAHGGDDGPDDQHG